MPWLFAPRVRNCTRHIWQARPLSSQSHNRNAYFAAEMNGERAVNGSARGLPLLWLIALSAGEGGWWLAWRIGRRLARPSPNVSSQYA